MTSYIKLSTLEYPRHQGDILIEHPEIPTDQLGDTFPCPSTYAVVARVAVPECYDHTKTVEQLPPVQIDGVWTQQFLVRDMTEEELQKYAIQFAEMQRLIALQEAAREAEHERQRLNALQEAVE